ncbi:inhibitor of vertebrate lysozyme family protein [Pseudomonas rubra]|uniref:Inhibitor of vertebrate lysozyme family protein n=1 Tax=Pseudomonas rubra TaxID=2942627 RepID=A0ABT5PB62_9PSED|nr:inhibitor of vertebrate lysozyme family protein [Pseudomonas rubra]MDD1015552.1 inhibitor of vertebrate lysozyme family protein [Pseudomonas rubra]MDD1038824.1 inhibitor of vertebrate lysozyme family protein [Pseudomonas rubra]MDD1153711.1 inhibitor of vertebrate lysozyme family protein [Pseudomonas rubra]
MSTTLGRALVVALMMGGSAVAMAANDGQVRANQILGSDPEYRETWQDVVKDEERLPEWVLNLSGTAEQQMSAVEEDGDKYLVGPLCESEQKCLNKRLIVAFSWDKDEAYGMLIEVPEGLPSDKSPTRHADYRWLGKPDEGMQALLKEQLKRDPNWY